MRLNPVLESLGTYPFVRLDDAKAAAVARGIELIDFGIGEPREETPELIRRALVEAIEPVSTYPKAVGLPVLREAVQFVGRNIEHRRLDFARKHEQSPRGFLR